MKLHPFVGFSTAYKLAYQPMRTNTSWHENTRVLHDRLIFDNSDVQTFSSDLTIWYTFCSTHNFRIKSEGFRIFCVLKKKDEYTLKSVSMSGRLHDNSRNNGLTALKFFTQHCHINISVKFEDEPNSLRIFWFSIGNTLIFYRFFDGKWSSSDFFENYRIECSFSRWFRIWT